MAEVASRLGMTSHSLYAWIKKYGPDSAEYKAKSDDEAEIRRLKKELKRVTEERNILKKAAVGSTCQRNTLFHCLHRSRKFQCFPWSLI